ncbi:MAG: four helix bundle protein [Lyngbya sp. HA4199-MV5]|jgi:four helix bundle protein|nr:four helix bundle protein [Lyngbya sp. HA4199-MV5]
MRGVAARSFQDLLVWQKAHQFVLAAYRFSNGFPKTEVFGLTSQFRRASVSVAANIAEGFRRKGRADRARFINIAQTSLEECRYYLILAKDLQYGDSTKLTFQLEEVSRLLTAYAKSVQGLPAKPSPDP